MKLKETACEKQACESSGLLTEYRDKILDPNRLLWMELFLHLADVSNPLKPFKLCHAWAMRVLEEFFLQGDARHTDYSHLNRQIDIRYEIL